MRPHTDPPSNDTSAHHVMDDTISDRVPDVENFWGCAITLVLKKIGEDMKGQAFYQGVAPAASGLPGTIHSTNADQPVINCFQRFFLCRFGTDKYYKKCFFLYF